MTTAHEQGVSTSVLTAMYNALKSIQLYPIENEIVGRALADLQQQVDRVFEREGGLAVWVAGNYMFVNDVQVRLDLADYAVLSALRAALRAHGIGRIQFEAQVRRDEWVAFLAGLAETPRQGAESLDSFRRQLKEAGVERILVGAPTALFTGEESVESVEAARRTYAYSVKAARDVMNGLVLGKVARRGSTPVDASGQSPSGARSATAPGANRPAHSSTHSRTARTRIGVSGGSLVRSCTVMRRSQARAAADAGDRGGLTGM